MKTAQKYTLANTKINFKNILTKENWPVSQSLTAKFTWERIDENNLLKYFLDQLAVWKLIV